MPRPTAIVCITGSELTRGETRDANGPHLGSHLTSIGVAVKEVLLLPDDPTKLAHAFHRCIEEAEIVLISGGLGPTADDLTVGVLAETLGRKVIQDPEARERMRRRVLKRWKTEDAIPGNFFKQAEVVEGSRVLLNPVGLAPGCLVETERGFVVTMPGVPRELRAMFLDSVVPAILDRFELAAPRVFRAKLLYLPESTAESRIQDLGIDFSRVEYGISARPGELLLKFIAHHEVDHPYVDEVAARLAEEFGADLVVLPEGLLDESGARADSEFVGVVHDLLVESEATVATVESCTGGLVAALLTDRPGSSAFFLGSIVAYQNKVKRSLLEVDPATLQKHGAVSESVCETMAREACQRFDADYGIGITGIAGPGGGSDEKPVGLVYIGLASRSVTGTEAPVIAVKVERNIFRGNREMVRRQTAIRALDLLRRHLILPR